MADGYITYSTKLDNKQLEKDLAKATKDVDKIESKLQSNKSKRLPLAAQVEDVSKQLDDAKAKLGDLQAEYKGVFTALNTHNPKDQASNQAYIEARGRQPELAREMIAAQGAVDGLQAKYDQAAAKLQVVDDRAQRLEDDLSAAKEKAGAIADKLSKGATASEKMGAAVAHADKQVGKFTHRVAQLAKRAFVFTIIMQGFRAIRDVMGQYVSANSEASAAMAQLKGALLTLAQPILSVVIPAFTSLINILTRVVAAAANLVSMLFGKSIKDSQKSAKAMYNEAEAIKAAGSAADKAAGSLAAFDEINQLSDNSGGGAAAAKTPDFNFDISNVDADMEKLLKWVELIGAGLLAWKLSDTFLGGLKTFAGLILTVNGAVQLVTAFRDAMENGWNLKNLLESISGLMMMGLGIGLLTGSWIPVLIAAIASVLLALTVATGHGEELIGGIRQVCQGFVDFIAGIFTGDIDRALSGVSGIFEGLRTVVDAVIFGLRDSILSFLDWLDEKTNGKFHDTIMAAKNFVTKEFENFRALTSELIDDLKLIFGGIVEFLAGVFTNNWDMAWNGLKNIFKGIINGIIALFEGMVNGIINGINIIIRGFKKLTAFELPDYMGGYKFEGINIPEIPQARLPRLATGAVIPPNREFMAVLGDQTNGRNLEAPEDLIRQIVREESGSSASLGLLEAILEAIREGHMIMVDKRVLGKVIKESMANAARTSNTATI